MTDIQQIRPQTTDEQLKELFSRTAKLSDAMSALLDPRWGANVGILPKDHPLYPKEVGEARQRAEEAIARVRQLAAERQTEGTNGEPCDADTLWPSEVLAALDQRKEG
jgi:hypothetical protein